MAAAQELIPTMGTGAACRALGLPRGVPARQRERLGRKTLMGPPAPRAPRSCPPLALDAQERQTLLLTLNSERFADTAPAAVHATLLGAGIYVGSVRTAYSTRSRTRFHADGGQHSTVIADTVPR